MRSSACYITLSVVQLHHLDSIRYIAFGEVWKWNEHDDGSDGDGSDDDGSDDDGSDDTKNT